MQPEPLPKDAKVYKHRDPPAPGEDIAKAGSYLLGDFLRVIREGFASVLNHSN